MSSQASTQVFVRIPIAWTAANGQRGFLSVVSNVSFNHSAAYSSQDRPKSESGRVPKLGLAADAASSGKMPSLTSMKRGSGYRSSFSGLVATVFGATGCVGRGVCNRLGKTGAQMIIPYRGDHMKSRRLKVCGDLGQVLFTPYELTDEEAIRRSMTHSNIVFNLIGREYETRNFDFKAVHVDGPRRLARIARESGVKRFIHISHVNAIENPEKVFLPNGSSWLRSKWQGEQAVLEEFPDATIIRSVDLYGRDDHFITYYCDNSGRLQSSKVPLWKKGNMTVKAPLHVSDLVSGIMATVDDPNTAGKIFEAFGPERFLLADLMDWMYDVMDKDNPEWEYKRVDLRLYPSPFIKAFILQKLPLGLNWLRAPTLDKLERSHVTDNIQGYPNLQDLGVQPGRVSDLMPYELDPYRAFRYQTYYHWAQRPPVQPLYPISRVQEKEVLREKSAIENLMTSLGLNPQ